jgi:hypothetical protein
MSGNTGWQMFSKVKSRRQAVMTNTYIKSAETRYLMSREKTSVKIQFSNCLLNFRANIRVANNIISIARIPNRGNEQQYKTMKEGDIKTENILRN